MRAGERMRASVERQLGDADALLTPVLPAGPPPDVRRSQTGMARSQWVSTSLVSFTSLWNLTGHPAIVLPLGRTSAGIPLAVQVVGRFGRDLDLIDVATRLEALVTEAP